MNTHPTLTPPAPASKPESTSRSEAQFFHIGILGTTESGKTCFLAALAMPRQPHPLHYKATWVPPGRWPGKELTKGREWISEAVKALREGRLPKGTPPDMIHAAVRYSITGAEKDKHWLQIIDYAGELLDETKAADEIADRLSKKLEQMDGLLVLAPYPPAGGDLAASPKALTTLCAAFNKVRQKESMKRIPIALAISKWDLSGHLNPEGAHDEDQAAHVAAFLEGKPRPMHAGVWDDLRASAWDECKVFAISAFGATTQTDTSRPRVAEPLLSYGLEEPLVWLTRQIIRQTQEEVTQRLNWLSWFRPRTASAAAGRTAKFRRRLMHGSKDDVVFRALQWKGQRRLIFSLAFWLMGSELAWDAWKHVRASNSLVDISGSSETNRGLDWLKEYGNSAQYWHVLYAKVLPLIGYGLSKEEATRLVASHYEQQEKHLYDQIVKLCLEEEENLYKLAEEYLSRFPSGPHASEISAKKLAIETMRDERLAGELFRHIEKSHSEQRLDEAYKLCADYLQKYPRGSHIILIAAIRGEVEQKRLESDTANWLKTREGVFAKIMSKEIGHSDRLDEMLALMDELRAYPHVPLSGTVKNQWDVFMKQLESARKDMSGKIETEKELVRIKGLIQADDLIEAGEALTDAQERSDKASFESLIKDFQRDLPDRLKAKCENISNGGEDWRKAVKMAEGFKQPALRPITESSTIEIDKIVADLLMEGDKNLYRNVTKNKNPESTNRYLEEKPIGSMMAEVQAYAGYLAERIKPRRLIYRLVRIDWSGNTKSSWFDKGTTVEINVSNKWVGRFDFKELNRLDANSDPNGLVVVTCHDAIQTDTHLITVTISKTVDNWTRQDDYVGIAKLVVSDFLPDSYAGEDLSSLELKYPDDHQNTLTIKIEGILPEPKLPEWHP